MHKIQVTNGSIHKAFEGRSADALNNARPHQTRVIVSNGPGPRARGHQDDQADDKEMSLAPNAARGHEEEAGDAHAEEEVAGQQSDVGEVQ